MKKSLRLIALALAATVVLSGCIKMEVNLELQSDDTVNGSMVFAVQEGLGELLAENGGEAASDEEAAKELFGDELSSDFDNAREEPYKQDGWVGTRVIFEGESLADFSDDGEFSIVRDGDTFVVSGPFDTDATSGSDTEMFEGAEMTLSITFPGDVTEHNGTLEGKTVTWDLLAGPEDLYAVGGATEGGAGIPIWLIIALVGVLLFVGVIVLVVVLVVRSGKKKADTTEAPPAPPAPVIEP
ncbi:MAG: hypothetical protein CVT64_01585 [Actinobacteria bacterium HGW-Actinobacteria-4]|nr:MAG: hypothetical protein CVT64_01585 [Actinobacteria bacterium HGW-Actinobacteria-4]